MRNSKDFLFTLPQSKTKAIRAVLPKNESEQCVTRPLEGDGIDALPALAP